MIKTSSGFQKPNFPFSFWVFGFIYISIIFFAILRKFSYTTRAFVLSFAIFLAGLVEIFSSGVSGDGKLLLITAPLSALLLLGTRHCVVLSGLSILTYLTAAVSATFQDFPIDIIPAEVIIQPETWLASSFLFITVLIGLSALIWQFARLNTNTFKKNDRLTSEGKSLRELTHNLQIREAELQAVLNAIGDQVQVIDNEGRILKNTNGSEFNPYSENTTRTKNVLRILPQDQAVNLLSQINQSLLNWQTTVFDYFQIENGLERWYSATISPIDKDKVVLINRDITDSINSKSKEREQETLTDALKSAASMLNSTLELQEVLNRLLSAVCEVIPTDMANIILLGDRGRLISTGRTQLSGGLQYTDKLNQMTLNDLQVLRNMKRLKTPLLIPDVALYPAWVDIANNQLIRSFLGSPIVVKEKVVGFLTLQSIQPDIYNNHHLNRLQSFIDLAGIAIENANLYHETQKLAVSDELTSLFNRRGLMDIGRREIDRAKRFHHPLSIAILDIDNFKHINDSYGHLAGDQLLNQIADCCRANFREIDVIARYGGDEFIILMIENEIEQAFINADRLREIISKRTFKTDAGNLSTTISIGVAAIDETTENLGQIIEKADRGLYLAKEAGRNRTITV